MPVRLAITGLLARRDDLKYLLEKMRDVAEEDAGIEETARRVGLRLIEHAEKERAAGAKDQNERQHHAEKAQRRLEVWGGSWSLDHAAPHSIACGRRLIRRYAMGAACRAHTQLPVKDNQR